MIHLIKILFYFLIKKDFDSNFQIESLVDELGFNQLKCGLPSDACGQFKYSTGNKYQTSLIKSVSSPDT